MKLTFRRIGAYLVDCLILFFALLIINIFIPTFGDVNEMTEKLTTSVNDYMEEKISIEEFTEITNDVNYDIAKATYLSSIAGIVVYILYFVVYQAYNNGQTLGKKILKIKVTKSDGNAPDMNSLFRRCLIPYGIFVNIILLVVLLFASEGVYTVINSLINNIHMGVIFVSVIMMCVKGRGIQDYMAGTQVEEL